MDRKQVLVPGGGGGGAWAPHGDAVSGWGDGADRAEGAGAGSQGRGETRPTSSALEVVRVANCTSGVRRHDYNK